MFEWDEEKDRRNIRRHGVDFALARRIFDGPVVTGIDDRKDYGEVREVSLGLGRQRAAGRRAHGA